MTGGTSGFISVVTHVASAQYCCVIELFDSDQVWEACELSYSPRLLMHAIMGDGWEAVMMKCALRLQGAISSPAMRLPMVDASGDEVSALRRALCVANLLWHTLCPRQDPAGVSYMFGTERGAVMTSSIVDEH